MAGNVRELQNAVEHGLALCAGSRVEVRDLPEELSTGPARSASAAAARSLADFEREHILCALERAGGNRTRAASELRIGLATLKRKLKAYAEELARVPAADSEQRRLCRYATPAGRANPRWA